MNELKYDIKRGAGIYRVIFGSRLKAWILQGKIKRGEVLVWRSGLSGWRPPEDLEELAPIFEDYESAHLKEGAEKQILPKRKKVKKEIKNILIIDDEKDLCMLLSTILSRKGYNVVTANTRREGITYLKRKRPDLVFLDLKLPDGDGIGLLSKIKEIDPSTVINIITAYGDNERRDMAKKEGVHGFIEKPFTQKDILKSIS